MKNLKENKPTADILMNSMRAMGYSFESAIADIIDNSISSGAKTIQLRFPIVVYQDMNKKERTWVRPLMEWMSPVDNKEGNTARFAKVSFD